MFAERFGELHWWRYCTASMEEEEGDHVHFILFKVISGAAGT